MKREKKKKKKKSQEVFGWQHQQQDAGRAGRVWQRLDEEPR